MATTTTSEETLPPPPPPSRRPNYALRRVVALAVVAAVLVTIVVAIWLIVGAATGDRTSQAEAPAAGTTSEDPTPATTPPTVPVVTSPRHNDLTQPPVFPTREPPVRVASEAQPLTVWTIGDSTARALGELLAADFDGNPAVSTRTIDKTSTGLTRQDYFDWHAALPAILAEGPPDVAVVSMGDNDAQPLQPEGSSTFVDVSSPEWITEYTRRLRGFVDQLTAAGTRVYLIGQPTMRDPTFDDRIAVVDRAYRAVAAADPEITYIDSRALLGDDAAGYTDTLPGPGGPVQVRNSDGIHLSLEGARWMARIVGRVVAADHALQAP